MSVGISRGDVFNPDDPKQAQEIVFSRKKNY